MPALEAPPLRACLLRLNRGKAVKDKARRAFQALAGFARSLKATYGDIEFALDIETEHGLADSGDLDLDLADLLASIGEAAKERRTAVVFFVDKLQYVPEDQLASLVGALHDSSPAQVPVTMVAAGLP